MRENLRNAFTPVDPDGFRPYLRSNSQLPELDVARLRVDLLIGEDRTGLRTPTAGDASIMIRYKNREGAVTSLEMPEEDLSVIQIQGSQREGYRLTSGMVWVSLFADKLVEIAQYPELGLRRLVMPAFYLIKGYEDTSEGAVKRYDEFAARARLRFSREEHLWARDIKKI